MIWSKQDDDKFIEALEKFGKDWKKVTEHVGNKTY